MAIGNRHLAVCKRNALTDDTPSILYRILSAIDAGSHVGGPKGRCWTIDPIDGTLGFLRKEQYAVCLALIVDGVVELGILACPNLGSESVGDESKGVLFLARKGEGSYSVGWDWGELLY